LPFKSVNSAPPEIWWGHEIFVPLHCQSEVVVTMGIKEKNCEH